MAACAKALSSLDGHIFALSFSFRFRSVVRPALSCKRVPAVSEPTSPLLKGQNRPLVCPTAAPPTSIDFAESIQRVTTKR